MLDSDYCILPGCGVATAAYEYAPSADVLRRAPEMEILCLPHYKAMMEARRERKAAEKVRCRHDGCTNEGALYPGGRWCPDHNPFRGQTSVLSPERARAYLKSSIAGVNTQHIDRLGGKDVVDVELPLGSFQDQLPHSAENERNQDQDSEVVPGAVSTEAILYSTDCPPEKIPTSVKSAIKTAEAHGWKTKCTVAIASDELFSVQFAARHHSGKQLTTRHEQPAGKAAAGFKVAWFQKTERGLPHKIGWREAMAVLKGEDPTDDRVQLIEAMGHVMDVGGEVVRVEVGVE